MATSGSTNFSVTASDVINHALRIVGFLSDGETSSGQPQNDALRSLNMMIKAWQAEGIGLWKNDEIAIFQSDEGYSYDIGPSGDHATSSYIKTEVATAAASAATSLVVDSVTGFGDNFDRNGLVTAYDLSSASAPSLNGALVSAGVATMTSPRKILIYSNGDDSGVTFSVSGTDADGTTQSETITGGDTTTVYSTYEYATVTAISASTTGGSNAMEVGQVGDFLGIERDSGDLQWTNIGAAVSTTLTLIDALSGAVAVDNHVYTYTNKISRPMELIEARIHRADDNETPLRMLSRQEYMNLADKDATGLANSVYLDPQRTNAKLYVWPACDDVQDWIMATVRTRIEDLDAVGNNFDLPAEWYESLVYNLAVRLGAEYGRDVTPSVAALAIDSKMRADDFDREPAPITFELVNY